ncbi:Protein MAIN-LIKE 1 [Glycine max]|nr:Protein MAIN-LIKE 1 [Glycine max]
MMSLNSESLLHLLVGSDKEACAVEDPPKTAEELNKAQQQQPIEEGVTQADPMTSVLRDFENHERPELKLSSHGRKMAKFGRPAPEIEGLVTANGLSPLIASSLDSSDQGLMFAFHKETGSFHLPIGEVTITLNDVASLLHLLIVGAFHSFEQLHVDDTIDMLVELLEVSAAEARAEMIQYHGSYQTKIEACHWIVAPQAFLLHLLGCTLFANKSATHVHVVFLDALRDLTQSGTYAWGVGALVHMYDNLNEASKSTGRQLAGYITLLQCWIYEPFLSIGSTLAIEDYDEQRPRACQWTSSKALPESHPFMTLAQLGDPPRVPLVQQYDTFVEPDMPQQSVAIVAPDEPDIDVHRPRHPDVYVAIIDKLERLLNLRISTEGTKAYTIAQECLSITRS